MKTPKIWSFYAWSYDSGVNFLGIYQELLEKVIGILAIKQGETILDLGSGTGNLEYKIFQKHCKFKKIYALDISGPMVSRALAKVNSPNIRFQICDINRKLPFASNSFDKIVLVHSLYTFASPVKVLREIHRVLKNNGKLIIANPYDKNGSAKIKEYVFKKQSFFWKLYIYLTKLPVIIINSLIVKKAHKGKFHFLNEKQMTSILNETGFAQPAKFLRAYADTDILFITRKL